MSKFNIMNPPKRIKKDGTLSKLNDLSVFRTVNNIIELAYGTFTVLDAEKVDKVWYVTLTDDNETFKIKQQQMKNKKLPKTRVIIENTQPVIAGLLPAPIDPLDYYVEQCIRIRDEFNNNLRNNPANYTTKGTLKRNIQRQLINYQPPTLEVGTIILGGLVYDKQMQCDEYVQFISSVCYAIHNIQLLKSIKRNLIRSYHPDTNSYFADPIKLDCVKNIFIDTEEEIIC